MSRAVNISQGWLRMCRRTLPLGLRYLLSMKSTDSVNPSATRLSNDLIDSDASEYAICIVIVTVFICCQKPMMHLLKREKTTILFSIVLHCDLEVEGPPCRLRKQR